MKLLQLVQRSITTPPGGGVGSITTPPRSLNDILNNLIGFATGLALTIASLVIIYAAYLMLTAGGKTDQFEQGKKTITYVVIGLFVLLLSRAIVTIIRELIIGP